MNSRLSLFTMPLLGLLLATGCSDPTTVSGKVTYEGALVENGAITFLPADGNGPSAGARIEGGRYQTEEMVPGPKVVQIIGIKQVDFTRSTEEKERLLKAARKRGDQSGFIERADTIPEDAEGNNEVVDVKTGKQEMTFELKRPSS